MNELFMNSITLGVVLSLFSYQFGLVIREKFKFGFINPLLISIVIVISFLLVFDIEYDSYMNSAKYISYLLTPATVSLAIPLYEQMDVLKANLKAIVISIGAGVITNLFSIWAIALVFNLNNPEYVTLLPKSITTAIGIGVVDQLGGFTTITVATIIMTGVFGNLVANSVCKLFAINNPVSKGIAIGTSAHAIGTSKAIEMGEIEGAMSGLAIVITGLLTVIGVGFFSRLI